MQKKCTACLLVLPLTDFYRGESKCKRCVCKRVKAYRIANEERVLAYDRTRAKLPHRKDSTHRKRWVEANPDGYRAHTILNNAIQAGKVTREPCEVCGNPRSHGHHEDYAKPLKVQWLCAKHHARLKSDA